MIIRAELRRKQSEYEGEACVVDKVIELPAQRFKQFSRALLADYDFIAENKNVIQYDADSRHCINDSAITPEHADYLRQKYLWGEDI